MFGIVTDSAFDMAERCEELDISVVPFFISFDHENYLKENIDVTKGDVYSFMVNNPDVFPKSAQPSIASFSEAFEKYAKEGKDVLCVTLSDKLTGSFNAALLAAEVVNEDYPDIKIKVVNSGLATLLQGLLVLELCKARDKGYSVDEAYDYAKEIIPSGRIFFTIENLNYLIAGGRIGKILGGAANMANARPLIVLKEGELYPGGLALGRMKSVRKVMDMFFNYFEKEGLDIRDYQLMVGYGIDIKEADKLRERVIKGIKDIYPEYEDEIILGRIGALIGCYTGPYPCGIGFIKKMK